MAMDTGGPSGSKPLFPLQRQHNVEGEGGGGEGHGQDWTQCSSFPGDNSGQRKEHSSTLDDVKRARAAAFFSSDSDDSSNDSFANRPQEGSLYGHHPVGKNSKKQKRKRKKTEGKSRKKVKSDLDKILEKEGRSLQSGRGGHRVQELQAWLNQEAQRRSKDDGFFLDKKGCYENVVYEGLYRLEVPAYHRINLIGTKLSESFAQVERQRFFSAKPIARERSRKLKRFRIHPWNADKKQGQLLLPAPAMLSLAVEEEMVGENDEQYVMRRTKEFNIATRERPFELQLWVEFAQFQDEAGKILRRKGSERTIAERKIAILEKGLSYHPGAEDLLLLLLKCIEVIEDSDSVQTRWERVLDNSPASPSLYAQALQSLAVERARQMRLGVGGKRLTELEEGLVILALQSVHFDLQSGFTEIAVAKIQCMIEWHFFGPKMQETALLGTQFVTMFEKFWDSQEPRIGEDGARGWGCWIEGDTGFGAGQEKMEATQHVNVENDGVEEKGWTGWIPLSRGEDGAVEEASQSMSERSYSESDDEPEISDLDESQLEEDEKELMAKLGVKLEEDLAKLELQKEVPIDVLTEWVTKEKERASLQWSPDGRKVDTVDGVEFEDIQEWVFELDSHTVKTSLVFGCLEALGINMGAEVCSNDTILSRLQENEIVAHWAIKDTLFQRGSTDGGGSGGVSSLKQEICTCWFEKSPGRARFVSRMLALLSGIFQDSVALCTGWIQTEISAVGDPSKAAVPQEICRRLLESHRDHMPLWLAYAQLEAKQGNHKAARKVLDTAYGSLPLMASRVQSQKPILALYYADMEMEKGGSNCKERALNVLFHLALNDTYQGVKRGKGIHRDAEEIVQSKRCFQTMITEAVGWQGGMLDATHMAWVMAGALFEELLCPDQSTGAMIAVNILRNVIESTGEEIRVKSSCHELLQIRLCRILIKVCHSRTSFQGASPKEVRDSLLAGLSIYRRSPALHRLLHQFEYESCSLSHLTRFVLSQCDDHPTTLNYLLALRVEALKPTGKLNLSNIIERALSIDCINQSPLIWIVYFLLELDKGVKNSGKRVMLRGVRSCPWAKALWMSGLEGLAGAIGDREVGDFLEVMKNKGVKVRTDVYEVLLELLDIKS